MGRPFYNRIARQWHQSTGRRGGPFKKYVLNDHLLSKIEGIDDLSILELGAGNGYFLPLMLRRFSGQIPSRMVVTDLSGSMLDLAQKEFKVDGAEYVRLDVRREFPFHEDRFDLVTAAMIFNEVSTSGLKAGLSECRRVLKDNGKLLAAITHPRFVTRLRKNGKLSNLGANFWTMPGKGAMRLPVVIRSEEQYEALIRQAGFNFAAEDLYPTQAVINERPGLKAIGDLPLALTYCCWKNGTGNACISHRNDG